MQGGKSDHEPQEKEVSSQKQTCVTRAEKVGKRNQRAVDSPHCPNRHNQLRLYRGGEEHSYKLDNEPPLEEHQAQRSAKCAEAVHIPEGDEYIQSGRL